MFKATSTVPSHQQLQDQLDECRAKVRVLSQNLRDTRDELERVQSTQRSIQDKAAEVYDKTLKAMGLRPQPKEFELGPIFSEDEDEDDSPKTSKPKSVRRTRRM